MASGNETAWWSLGKEELAALLQTSLKEGLNQEEVFQRRKIYGLNQLPQKKRFSLFKLFLNQFSSVIIWLLLGAIIVAALLGEWIDTIAISVIVFLNAVLGFFQEYRAERSMEALQKLTHPSAKVIRNGKTQIIASEELVPGDLLLLEAGDSISADGRVVQSINLMTQEAALTGESLPVDKIESSIPKEETIVGDQRNMGFMGTAVVKGKGRMVITTTGKGTELGKIATLLQSKEDELTPLQVKLNILGNRLTWICIAIVLFVFAAGLWRGSPFIDSLLIAISLAVAAIPEGLPAVVTIALSIGVRKMAERKALIRRLPSVETLGCATVICTDKTGTLTQNEMVVKSVWVDQQLIEVSGEGYEPEGKFEEKGAAIDPTKHSDLLKTLQIAALCNNADLFFDTSSRTWKIRGDPTEAALLTAAKKAGLDKAHLESEFHLIEEIPFESERKIMSMVRENKGEQIVFVKGAADVIAQRSSTILLNGKEMPLTPELRTEILQENEALAGQALRVLGTAYRLRHNGKNGTEENLTFVGLLAMHDPPRPEAKRAIEICGDAGIRIIMITGDHKNTAVAIAQELELLKNGMLAVTGYELEKMSEAELNEKIRTIEVYARTSPELKLKIVKAWKHAGEIVAMTGDGVNDAPAIKEADIGLAMGQTGTDVTKEASDMVILDDNFATIVNAIEEGRGIYDNIHKFINYLISCNIAELLIIFASIVFNFRDPNGHPFVALTAVQLLWLNLVTDGLPAIALSMDPVDPKAMERPPRKPDEAILTWRFSLHLFAISCVIAAGTLLVCYFALQQSAALAYTMTFTMLVVLELVRVQMVRVHYNMKLFSNRLIIIALATSIALQLMVVYIPFLQKLFGTISLGWKEWGIILAASIGVFVISAGINALFKVKK